MNLEQLVALEAIKRLKAEYCYFLDLHEWDNYANLFTEDATLDTDTAVSTQGRDGKPQPQIRGRAAIRKFLAGFLDNAVTVHHVHSPIIDLTSPETAAGIWAMEDEVELDGFHLHARGHYHETYRLDGGEWRIASLHLTRTRIDMLKGSAEGPEGLTY